MKKKKSRIIIGVLIIAAVGAYGFMAVKSGQKKKEVGIAVEISTVATGELVTTVTGTALVDAEDKIKVWAEIAGIISEVYVKEGEVVRQGDLLFTFADRQLVQAVEDAEAGVKDIRQQLENLQLEVKGQDSGSLQIRQARQTLAQARLSLAEAERNQERIRSLYERGAVAKEELDRAVTAWEEARLKVEQAETGLDQALLKSRSDDGQKKLLQLKLNDAQRKLRDAKEELAKTKVYAPQDGMILSCPVKKGMSVAMGTELCQIGNTDYLEAVLPVDEVDITQVKTGQKVTITHPGISGVEFLGTVLAIAPQAEKRGDEYVFPVKIGVENKDGRLLPGMSVDAEIETNHLSNVLTVPLLAVLEEENKNGQIVKYLFLVKDGKATKTEIETGISNDSDIEVKAGIALGDTYVSGDYETILHLKDGSSVRAKAEQKNKKEK